MPQRDILAYPVSMRIVLFVAMLATSRLALANDSSCYNIQDSDRRAYCLGTVNRQTSYCFNIRDGNWRSLCLAVASGQKSYCYNIQSNDLRNQCQAMVP